MSTVTSWFWKKLFKGVREFRIEFNSLLLKFENILLCKYYKYEIIRKNIGGK